MNGIRTTAALVKQRREFLFAENTSHLARGSEAAGHERRNRIDIGLGHVRAAFLSDQVPVFVDEHGGAGLGSAQELAQGAVDLLDVLLVEDQASILQIGVGELSSGFGHLVAPPTSRGTSRPGIRSRRR